MSRSSHRTLCGFFALVSFIQCQWLAAEPSHTAFDRPLSQLHGEQKLNHRIGQAIFEKIWIPAPSSTQASDGLGPMYNARACSQCHQHNGRTSLPSRQAGQSLRNPMGLIVRLNFNNEGLPDPYYGDQIQTFATGNLMREADVIVTYNSSLVDLGNSKTVELLSPTYSFDVQQGPFSAETRFSPRIGQALAGLGLIEAIPEADILAAADPLDKNNDDISGKANTVWNFSTQKFELGRFGWKAGQPTLEQQIANALHKDIGLSSRTFKTAYGDCTEKQSACREQPHGESKHLDGVEVADTMLDTLIEFLRNTTPAKAKTVNSKQTKLDEKAGQRIFSELGCAACHRPSFITRSDSNALLDKQKIYPYSDFLLHDMGEALADNAREFDATGSEWRTAPLWGLSHTRNAKGEMSLLHDGRARNYLEAILFHGGEAESAKQATFQLNATQRQQLILFLESL